MSSRSNRAGLADGAITLQGVLFQGTSRPRDPTQTTPAVYKSDDCSTDSKTGLFPLHSPLLGESWLVSFPPLSDMLKFSGSSYRIGGWVVCDRQVFTSLWVLSKAFGVTPDQQVNNQHSDRYAARVWFTGRRKVRSKFRCLTWFLRFASRISLLAAFFIDMGAKASIAKSLFDFRR